MIFYQNILQNTAYCLRVPGDVSLQLHEFPNCFVVEKLFLYKLHCCFAFYAFKLDEKEIIINSQ